MDEKESKRKPKNAPENKAIPGTEEDKEEEPGWTPKKKGDCGGCGKKRKTRVFVREKKD